MNGPVGGTLFVKANGRRLQAKGNWEYREPGVQRESVIGADGVHGYTIKHLPGLIRGDVTLDGSFSMAELRGLTDATLSLETARGDVCNLTDAYYTEEGIANTEEGNTSVAFESATGAIVPA